VVDRVGGHAHDAAGGEVVAEDLNAWSRWHEARESEGGRGVDAHGLTDDSLEVLEIAHLRMLGHDSTLRHCCVKFSLQFLNNAWSLEDPVEQGTGGVAGGVAAGDELGEGFGGEFGASQLRAGLVAAFHEAGEEIDALLVLGSGVKTRGDAGDGHAGEVLDGFHALVEEWIGEVLCVWPEEWHAAEGAADLAATVEHFDGWSVGDWTIRSLLDRSDVLTILQHAKWLAESKVSDDVEGKEVEPVQ